MSRGLTERPPAHRRVELSHYAGLDGVRGIAVAAVLLYHGGAAWADGGFLGVEVFFVLSGFLITSLLLAEWTRSSSISLGAFWARRARRLLPALFCLVAVIGLYYAVAGSAQAIPGLKGDGISALIYYSNWHQIAAGTSYFAATGPVSPLEHTWSLAIEEQFYLVWPIVLGGVLWLATRVTRRAGDPTGRPSDPAGGASRLPLLVLFGVTVVGAVASAIDTAVLFAGGRNLNRVYYGTDTRAASLLIGASLAIGFALWRAGRERAALDRARPRVVGALASKVVGAGASRVVGAGASRVAGAGASRVVGAGAVFALIGVLAAIGTVHGSAGWLYPYGLLALDAAVALLIVAAVAFPGSLAARLLALGPLRALGKISYGLYLWHFPLFLWLSAGAVGMSGSRLLLVRLAATLAVSTASYFLIEQPIRQRRRPTWVVRALAPLAAGGAVAALLLASAADQLPVGIPAAATLPQPPPQLRGNDPSCTVALKDTSDYGEAPLPESKQTSFVYAALGAHKLTWSGSGEKTFQTCPPKRVLVVGDSLAFTLGVPWLENEERYGIQLADGALLGCAFTTEGELDVDGTWEGQSEGCSTAAERWAAEARAMRAQTVVVELGYRDQFDWKINGKVVHLGQPAFDSYVRSQIERFVQDLGAGGRKVLFLSVPYTSPPNLPNGSPAPAASPDRHSLINSMLEEAARRHPKTVSVLDIDQTVSPGDHYNAKINGQLCRFDGVHFSAYCSDLLEPRVLGEVRKLVG
ncbi:MAG TPA: acyltransferase family protein [Solirubrobacteraceae bacterium]|nr:acyltransferase family protein [Solirubrobacteraceae bacterium]